MSFLQENITFSKDPEQFLLQLTTLQQQMAKNSNAKEIGTYDLVEIPNGQLFFGANPQQKRGVYRKCFQFGAILTGAALNIPHGITGNPVFTRIYGTCVTAVDQRPLPFVSRVLNDMIQLQVVGANIAIGSGIICPNIVSGIVVLEFFRS